jgi:hypothetical protein
VQCRGIGRQLQQLSSDSTPHDRVTIPQICLARSPALDRPRQSTLRYPTGVSNRPTGHHARRDPLPIHQPLHRPPTRCGGSIPITNISRGSQISITPVARPSVPLRAVSSLGGFRTPTAELAAPSLMRPASETLHKLRNTRKGADVFRCCTSSRRSSRHLMVECPPEEIAGELAKIKPGWTPPDPIPEE